MDRASPDTARAIQSMKMPCANGALPPGTAPASYGPISGLPSTPEPLPPFRELFSEAAAQYPGVRHEGRTATLLERALASLPLEEQGDAALDAVESQAARMVAWYAWRLEVLIGRERSGEASAVRLPPLNEAESERVASVVRERDRAVDALLKLRERRGKIAHLANVNQRGERVLKLVPEAVLPMERERPNTACGSVVAGEK